MSSNLAVPGRDDLGVWPDKRMVGTLSSPSHGNLESPYDNLFPQSETAEATESAIDLVKSVWNKKTDNIIIRNE